MISVNEKKGYLFFFIETVTKGNTQDVSIIKEYYYDQWVGSQNHQFIKLFTTLFVSIHPKQ